MKKQEVRRLGEAEERIMRNDYEVLFLCRPIFRASALPIFADGDSEAFLEAVGCNRDE
jgi:hypothetical protein